MYRGCTSTQECSDPLQRLLIRTRVSLESLGQGPLGANTVARSICGGLRAFSWFQVLGTLAPESLIVAAVVWTRLRRRHSNARKRCRLIDAAFCRRIYGMLCNGARSLAARASFGSSAREVEIERIKTPPSYVCQLTARSLGKGLQLLLWLWDQSCCAMRVARGITGKPASTPAANTAVYGVAAIEMQSLSCGDAVRLRVYTRYLATYRRSRAMALPGPLLPHSDDGTEVLLLLTWTKRANAQQMS